MSSSPTAFVPVGHLPKNYKAKLKLEKAAKTLWNQKADCKMLVKSTICRIVDV
jgi:hypothetical protein